jgi:hypothetical protein
LVGSRIDADATDDGKQKKTVEINIKITFSVFLQAIIILTKRDIFFLFSVCSCLMNMFFTSDGMKWNEMHHSKN